jgi:HlyD family secretion protein
VAAAEAALAQKKAVLKEAQLKLSYTTIKSPIAGVVIDRRVNVGQMTSVGPNAPSLFLIAKDLRRIQVWASVDEADIGRIHVGTPVRFTVDACPGKTFRGKVDQIRLNATMTQNVVTYTVVIATDNPDGRVLPYLTAKVQFE